MKDRIAVISESLLRLEPIIVSTLLSPRAAEQFAAGSIGHGELKPYVAHIRKLSEEYVSERRYAIPPIGRDEAAAAYALYFLPVNFAKLLYLMHELPASLSGKPLSILDFGCGPGTGALAAREFFGPSRELTLADHSPAMLAAAEKILKNSNPEASPPRLVIASDILREEGSFDLVIAANVLTELPEPQRTELAARLLKKVRLGGALMILEPALKTPTKEAMELRDQILEEEPGILPVFPCTRRDGCPMLREDPESWCHGTLRWESSRLVSQLDEVSGFNKHRLKYTAFIFQRGGELKRGLRILKEPQRKKYGHELTVCGPERYGDTVVRKSAPEEIRRAVSRADQFELLDADGASFESA